MASEHTNPDDDPTPDPFEADLVAYLDGELDPEAAREVEQRLANDSAVRARAAELKKSFELLDFLPRPEPSPNFTSRTLDKLPTVTAATPLPNGTTRTPHPDTGDAMSLPFKPPADPRRRTRWAGLLRAAMVGFAVTSLAAFGYFATAKMRPYLFPNETVEAKLEVDPRVIELLPLYAGADDIAFVVELAKPEYFGDDPAVAFDGSLKVPSAADRPTGKDFDALVTAFRALPSDRQAAIIKLDQALHAKEPKERDRLLRALEAYTVWLERLPEAQRRAVLSAPATGTAQGNTRDRLAEIVSVRQQQWLATLPPDVQRSADLVEQWKMEEQARRDRLGFARKCAEEFTANRSPWPFDTEAGRKEVLEFARTAFKPDDIRRCRLTQEELNEYRRTLQLGQRDDSWKWFGVTVYELARLHPYLPEPENPKQLITDMNDLPEAYRREMMKKGFPALRINPRTVNKWPDYPLEILDQPFAKAMSNPPPLGPGRVTEFKKPVQDFATKDLFPKLIDFERLQLDRLVGKWPEYSQKFLKLADQYELSVPGVTLPGSPRRWDATYGGRFPARP
jgi:hypothetical protein